MNAALLLAKSKARFQTPRGPLSVEDLFDLPLTGNFSLDTVSTTVLAELDATPRKSLVVTTTKSDKIIEAKIEVLKEIIEFKKSYPDRNNSKSHYRGNFKGFSTVVTWRLYLPGRFNQIPHAVCTVHIKI